MYDLVRAALLWFVVSPFVIRTLPKSLLARVLPGKEVGRPERLLLHPHLALLTCYGLLFVWVLRFLPDTRVEPPLMEFAIEAALLPFFCMAWLPFYARTEANQPSQYWNKIIYALLKGILLIVSLSPLLTRKDVIESVQIGAFLMILIQETALSVFLGAVIFRWHKEDEEWQRLRSEK